MKKRIREGMRRKGSEWCSEGNRKVVESMKECFLVWRRARSK